MEKMLTKFESKSNRVKGLAFHASRPWILASLHNGQIQLWDYRMGTLLDRFDEHDGPVRGVDFHRTQSLLVSGGDDYKVKVWDYKLRRCLFTLLGHLDYIRTVHFHAEYPWIVSASDDQTLRIWNWQSRNCLSVLTGHNHYVMCAAFHPKEDMIVSASLDQTVRVWDTSGLRKKNVRGAPPAALEDSANVVSRVNNELFGGNDAVVKYVLEGHERGVNWAAFHPTLPLIISGADDRQVKLWRMNETKAWEVDTMRGHTNNVSCVLFHPKHELIVSNSEDRTIRVWDISKRLGVQTFRRESDRFWILAAHPEQNLLAAGHDSGMTVFKLERERPAFDAIGTKCFYVKDRYLRVYEYANGKDLPLVSLRRTASTSATPGVGGGPRYLSFNAFNKSENNVLIVSDAEGGSYELISFASAENAGGGGDAQDLRRGAALSAVFIARDRFVVLDKSRQLQVKNFQNETLKRSALPLPGVDALFTAGTSGRLLLKTDDRVLLYDLTARKTLAELQISKLKYVHWNADFSYVALMAKHQLVVATKQLEHVCTVNETVRLKGGAWDTTQPVFIYTTLNHVKYVLASGDRGLLRALETPVYPTKAALNALHCLDREGKMRVIEIDATEAMFKLALAAKNYGEVMRIVRSSRLCGQAIISFLQDKGYPEVALHFVHDNKTRFKLALACGNMQVALSVAQELGEEAWKQLAAMALSQGLYDIVEMAYQKIKAFDSLSFLYLLTGHADKLRKMQKIAELRHDVMSLVHNSLYVGDVEERVKALESTGQHVLALVLARNHGLTETTERLTQLLDAPRLEKLSRLPATPSSLLLPPTPILRAQNWPLLATTGSAMPSGGAAASSSGVKSTALLSDGDDDDFADATAGEKWGDDDLFDDEDDGGDAPRKPASGARESKGGGWDGDDDLDLSDEDEDAPARSAGAAKGSGGGGGAKFQAPTPGRAVALSWPNDSAHAADHFAAGAADSGLHLLHRQIALTSAAPLKQSAVVLFAGCQSFVPGLGALPSLRLYLTRDAGKSSSGSGAAPPKTLPLLALQLPHALEQLKTAYKQFSAAQLSDCGATLTQVVHGLCLLCVATKAEANDVKELLEVAREYLLALRIKAAYDDVSAAGDVPRSLELAAYFTHVLLQPAHLLLALKTAMAAAFKNKNFINAASFARRILELPEASAEKHAELRSKAQKVLQKSEKEGRNEHRIDYDERNPFAVDALALKPLYKGVAAVKCAYCLASYSPQAKGQVCTICGISAVGVETVGLVTQSAPSRVK